MIHLKNNFLIFRPWLSLRQKKLNRLILRKDWKGVEQKEVETT